VYAIIGNHDIWLDVDVIKSAFNQIRLPILVNQGFPITEANSTLYIAGLDDGWSGTPDLDAALENAPIDAPTVLLLHEPDLADKYSQVERIVLQLSGHSHGGQVRIPGFGAFILPYLGQKYDFGLYKVRDMWLYTNRGIGNISVPFRYNCAPEITEFTLLRA
jgi:predicted MPP superfamily phosphohydrolase